MRQHYPWLVVTWWFFSVIGEGMVNKCDGRVYIGCTRIRCVKVKGWCVKVMVWCEGDGKVCESVGMACGSDGMVCGGDEMVCEGGGMVCEVKWM